MFEFEIIPIIFLPLRFKSLFLRCVCPHQYLRQNGDENGKFNTLIRVMEIAI